MNSMKKTRINSIWELSLEDWITININALRGHSTRPVSTGYFMRDNHVGVIMKKKSKLDTIIHMTVGCT